MKLNIIHLPHGDRYPPHRQERYANLLNELMKEGITDYLIWPGVIKQEPKHGISQAFKNVVAWAKSCGDKMIAIAEDDICFYGNGGAWEYFLKNIPDDFDIYTGSYYSGDHNEQLVVKGFRGMTLTIIHERFYDRFLSIPENCHIDGGCAISGAVIKVSPLFVAYQMISYSEQRKRMADDSRKHKNKLKYNGD